MNRDELIENIKTSCATLELQCDCISSGPIDAQIAIVSDYPGQTETKTGLPFSGAAGKLLWRLLNAKGYTRNNVYVTNIVKRQIDHDDTKVTPKELELWTSILEVELSLLPNLRYLLILGSNPLKGLLKLDNVSNWRGSVVNWKNALCFISNNPAFVGKKNYETGEVEDPLREVIFKFDIGKFHSLVTGKYEPITINYEVCTNLHRVAEVLAYCREHEPVSVDIEHLQNETACIGLSVDDNLGYVIPFFAPGENLWTTREEDALRLMLSGFLAITKVIGQNFSTDIEWLWFKDRIRVCNTVGDTLLAHHLLYPTLPHSLAFLTSQYTWHPYYKDEGKDWRGQGGIEQFWQYNARDTVLTKRIHFDLLGELERANLLDFYNNHVIHILPHLCEATILGIKIDVEEKQKLEVYYTEQFDAKKAQLVEWVDTRYTASDEPSFNPASPAQVSNLLYKKLMVPSRTDSTNATHLKKLLSLKTVSDEAKEIIQKLLALRKDAKFLSTYARTAIDDDNRFRAHYSQFGTQTAPGRLSSRANQWGTASNVQNQPTKSRTMFVADHGYCFVYIDLAQAEARYVGWIAGITTWKQEFERARLGEDIDCHRSLASRIFNVDYADVPTKDYEQDGSYTIRYLGKRARHGLNYRMSPVRFAESTGVKLSMANIVFNAYHKETPELRRWWQQLEHEVRQSKAKLGYGVLYNSLGRRLCILEALTDESLKSIVAFKPQSTIGDWLQRVWYLCHEDQRWPDTARIINNVHDSLMALCKHEDAQLVAQLLVEHAQKPINVNNEDLIIPADCKISYADEKGIHRWSNLKGLSLNF